MSEVIKFLIPHKDETKEVLIDASDAVLILGLGLVAKRDPANENFYVRCSGTKRGPSRLLHRIIMNPAPSQVVDHINGNGLDNRRSNLRVCTALENRHNSRPRGFRKGTKYKGITKTKSGNYSASIMTKERRIHIGVYPTEIEAAHAYDKVAKDVRGEFAKLNFPDDAA